MANLVQIKARVRPSLRAALKKSAKRNERSVNAEMVARLEESFEGELNRDRHQEIISRLDALYNLAQGDFHGL